jgi:hypothetical protein
MAEQQRKADAKRSNDFNELKHHQAPDESANSWITIQPHARRYCP